MKEKEEKLYCLLCKDNGINSLANFSFNLSFIDQKAEKGEVKKVLSESYLCDDHIYSEPFLSLIKLRNIIKEKKNLDIKVPKDFTEFKKNTDIMIRRLEDERYRRIAKNSRLNHRIPYPK